MVSVLQSLYPNKTERPHASFYIFCTCHHTCTHIRDHRTVSPKRDKRKLPPALLQRVSSIGNGSKADLIGMAIPIDPGVELRESTSGAGYACTLSL